MKRIKENDTKTQYHNERFKEAAEAHGLHAFFLPDTGRQQTGMTEEATGRLYAALAPEYRKALLTKSARELYVRKGVIAEA